MSTSRGEALLRNSLMIDNHACMPLRAGDSAFLPQLQRAKAVGFSAVSLNIGFGEQNPEEHLRMLAWFRHWLKERPEEYALIETPEDIAAARTSGRLGIYFDIEGARGVADELSLVQLYYDLGVRWMLIAYNRENLAGFGCYDDTDGGLTAFGKNLVAEMNRVGMTVCCSHTGSRTARDVLETSTRPVIFSHSNCSAVHAHPRNISDDMIRGCAARGGVVGINGIGDFLAPQGADIVDALVRHIDHAVQLVGPTHVGLGLDYVYDTQELLDYLATMKHTFPDADSETLRLVAPEDLPRIVEGLLVRGYADADIREILGGSWLRVARETWRVPG